MAFLLLKIIFVACFVLDEKLFTESQMLDSQCGPLEYKNAQVSINKERNIAKIICNSNYSNQGDSEVRCFNRMWYSLKEPNCVHNDCLNSISAKNIVNGRFQIYIREEYFLHYSCNENYVLKGRMISTCNDGKWSSHPPICRLKSNVSKVIDDNCLHNATYYTLENGNVSVGRLGEYGDLHLTYTCNRNYKLTGFRIVTCIDGIWMDTVPPRCEFSEERKYAATTEASTNGCEPFEYKNGQVSISKTGNIATVECNSNYTLVGNSKFYCIRGTWQQRNFPLCVHNDCLPNSLNFTLENGKLSNTRLIDDENIGLIYTCNDGYKLLGKNTTVCSNGKLLSKPPVCKIKEVEVKKSPIADESQGCGLFKYRNARVTINEEGIARVNCNSNYFLYGYSFFECVNGKWEQDNYPRCIHVDCFSMKHRSIQDGVISKTSFGIFGEVNVNYECNVGFNMTGERMTSCYNGEWSSNPPVCVLRKI